MVSIIICFYERLEHLKRCLDSLHFSSCDFDEVIITDDGSSNDTVTKLQLLISEYDFPIKHVWQPHKNFQVAAARNNGIRNSKGDYLIFFDCDFLILKDTIQQHLDRAKPGRFVAGHCKYLDKHQTNQLFSAPFSAEELTTLYHSTPDNELRKSHRRFIKRTILMRMRLVPFTKQSLGGHLSIHRKDIEAVNGYDENYVGWGGRRRSRHTSRRSRCLRMFGHSLCQSSSCVAQKRVRQPALDKRFERRILQKKRPPHVLHQRTA
ncbi:glycosyltransferase [Thermodesulfobacteriota bacterium]